MRKFSDIVPPAQNLEREKQSHNCHNTTKQLTVLTLNVSQKHR